MSSLSFRQAAHRVGSSSAILMVKQFSGTVGAVMSFDDAVPMGPTIAVRIEMTFPFFDVECDFPSFAFRCCATRSYSKCCGSSFGVAKFVHEDIIYFQGRFELVGEQFVCVRQLSIAPGEVFDNVPIGCGRHL
jgi:hypothetical protein